MEMTTFAERFAQGTSGALALSMIAFSVVFLVLIGLTLIIFAVRFIAALGTKGHTDNRGGPSVKTTPKAPSAPVAQKAVKMAGGDEEVVAAIAAALAASCGGVVTSIRRTAPVGAARLRPTAKAWKLAGRMDLSEGLE